MNILQTIKCYIAWLCLRLTGKVTLVGNSQKVTLTKGNDPNKPPLPLFELLAVCKLLSSLDSPE